MSAALQMNPLKKRNEYRDDLESFLHTVAYVLMRYSKTNVEWKLLAHVKYVYDYAAVDIQEGMYVAVGGDAKMDKILLEKYIPRDLQFVGRDNLADGLLDIASFFRVVYEDPTSTNHLDYLQKCIDCLNEYEDGGRRVWQKLQDLIDSSGVWTDEPAKRVVFALSSTERAIRQQSDDARLRMLPAYEPTPATCISVIGKHVDEGMFEAELVIRKKRRLESPLEVI